MERVGPVVIGIELEKYLSDQYRPRLVAYNLLDTATASLCAIIDQTIKNSKGLDVSVEYSLHEREYGAVVDLFKQKARIDLSDQLTVDDIIKGIFLHIENDRLGNPFWSCQAIMQLSQLLEDPGKKEDYFNKALSLLQNKLPAAILDTMTKGTKEWIDKIKSLSGEDINKKIQESIQKYKFENVPLAN